MATYDEVRQFILEIRIALSRNGGFVLKEREKNIRSLARLGLVPPEVPSVIRGLSAEDFSAGPLDDDLGREEKWWIFGPVFQGVPLYVKVALSHGRLICISFHDSEHSLECPFRKKEAPKS